MMCRPGRRAGTHTPQLIEGARLTARREHARERLTMSKANTTVVGRVVATLTRIFAPALNLVAVSRNRGARRSPPSLKALLAAAPLEDIDLKRAPDFGRDIDL